MWILTDKGFFSIVKKQDTPPDALTVRARVLGDLERLKQDIPGAGPIETGGHSDYPHRCIVDRADFAAWVSAQVLDLDYSNFKNHVGKVDGEERQAIYHSVWFNLIDLENLPK